MSRTKFYWTIFSSTFVISAFTVGGGFVIIPLFQNRFVKELGWIEDNEILYLIAIAQSAPGSIAINGASVIGYRLAGLLGAFVATLGTALPPLLIMSLISMFYSIFRDSHLVSAVLTGMQAGVAAVIVSVVIKMAKDLIQSKNSISLIVLAFTLIATFVFKLNIIFMLLMAAGLGTGLTLYQLKQKRGEER